MNIDSNRNPLNTPQMRVGDPSASAGILRAMEQSEGNEFPTISPSIPQDHLEPGESVKVTNRLKEIDCTLTALDAALGALYQQTRRLESLGVDDAFELDSFRTEFGPRCKLERVGNKYKITPRPNTRG